MELTEQEKAELARLGSFFPFRIIYGAKHPETGEFRCGATYTRRPANDYARKGWLVFILEKVK